MALIKISELPIGDSNISSGDMLPFVNHETLQTQRLTVQGLEDYLNVAGLIDSAISQFDQDGDGSDHDSARTQGQIDSAIGALTTSDIPEGTNLYYTDARVTTLVDSAYVSARVEADLTLDVLDSAEAIQLINETVDSAYVQARVTLDGTHDSALTLQQITSTVDSAYVSARVEADLTLDVLDSAEAIQLINETVDSAYVNALVDFPGGDDGHDSARVQGQIDSAISSALPDGNSGSTLHYDGNGWVPTDNILIPTNARPQLRFQPSGALLTMDSAQVQFSSLNVTTFSHPTYGAQLTLQGQSGDPSRLTTVEVRAQDYHDLSGNDIITTTVDSAYVQARVTLDGTHDSALVQGQIDSNATSYLKQDAFTNNNITGEITYTQYTGTVLDDSAYRRVKIGSVYGFGIDEGASVIFAETPGGQFMVNDVGVMLQQADLIVRTPNNPTAKKGSARGFWEISGMSLLGDSATIGTMAVDSATIGKVETPTLTSPSGTNLNIEYGGSTRIRISSGSMEIFETANYNSSVSAFVAASGGADALIHKGYVDDNMPDSAQIQGQIDSSASNYLQTTAYGFDNTVDSATINKLTVGPDSADDSKLYFETGAGTHVLEGREEGAVDMHAWVSYDIPGGNKGWSGVAYGNGKWVAVAQNFDERVAYSTDGIEWTTTDAAIQAGWSDIIYDGSKFVALAIMAASTGENIMTSTDGVTWNSSDTYTLPGTLANWTGLAYGDGKYVAVANNRQIAYSTNGTSWTLQTAPHASGSYYGVSYGDGQFVLVGSSGNVATSSDGQTWTSRTASTSAGWNDVAYGNDLWVAISADAPNRVMYSSDGAVTWTDAPQYAVFENAWEAITFGDGKFVAVARNNSQRLMWSTNGVSWTAKSIPYNFWADISYANNRFVAVSQGTSNHVVTLDHDADKEGLFYDGELVATTENLRPLFDKLNQISTDFDAAQLDFSNLQDSAGGLATGKLYRDSDTIRVVL